MKYLIGFAELKHVCKHNLWKTDHNGHPIDVCNKKEIPNDENWASCSEVGCPLVKEWLEMKRWDI